MISLCANLHMARAGQVDDTNYDASAAQSVARYSCFQPGQGIQAFLREHWAEPVSYGR